MHRTTGATPSPDDVHTCIRHHNQGKTRPHSCCVARCSECHAMLRCLDLWLSASFHKKRRRRHQKRPAVGDPGTPTRSTHECPSERRATPRARNCFPGRQVHARAWPHLHQRHAGTGASADAAAGARPRRWAEHGGLHLRLPRLAAGGAGPGLVEGQEASGRAQHRLPGGAQRRPGRHGGLGLAAGQSVSERQVQRRVRHVVRQGAGRGPHDRRVQARQLGGLVRAWRRAGTGRR